jgi:ribosomal protein S18 acetylase RimI-like enzyme
LDRLIVGYTSHEVYRVSHTQEATHMHLSLERVPLETPYNKRYEHTDDETLDFYRTGLAEGFSFGAYDGERCIGLALASPQHWNNSLWVHELHVAEAYQGRGVGRGLIEAVAKQGQAVRLRVIVCETQTTNVPAIDFYRRMGFVLHGVDLSLYSNADWPDGEVALFMKRPLI